MTQLFAIYKTFNGNILTINWQFNSAIYNKNAKFSIILLTNSVHIYTHFTTKAYIE